jgi:hypothetical protein
MKPYSNSNASLHRLFEKSSTDLKQCIERPWTSVPIDKNDSYGKHGLEKVLKATCVFAGLWAFSADSLFCSTSTELEFLKRLWGLGTGEEEGYRTGPPGYIGWRNSFLGIDSGAPYTFKNTSSVEVSNSLYCILL